MVACRGERRGAGVEGWWGGEREGALRSPESQRKTIFSSTAMSWIGSLSDSSKGPCAFP